jgi:hypothetical protein
MLGPSSRKARLRWILSSVVEGAGGVGGEFGQNGARALITVAMMA